MSTPLRAGGEVDAFCARCKLKLAHTILAMVGSRIARVRCNTCQGEHAYRASKPGAPRKRKTESKPEAKAVDLDELLEGRDVSQAHRYSTKDVFAKGEMIEHPTFGTGVVLEIRGDRIDGLFRVGVKTLAQRKAFSEFTAHHATAPANEVPEEPEEPSNGTSGRHAGGQSSATPE